MLDATRLTALRQEMATNKYDAFLVPLADAHQGEYIAPCDKRLKWLTGFTGSAGMAIVRTHDAAIFVDGRYTVQVAREVDLETFSHQHLHNNPPAKWLRAHANKGERIAYDPWLHTPAQVKLLEEEVKAAGAALVAVAQNPIDAVWHDRPARPLADAIAYPEEMAGESASARRARIGELVRGAGADRLVLTLPDNMAWLMNVRGGDVAYNPMPQGFIILAASGTADWFIEDAKLARARSEIDLEGVTIHAPDAFLPTLADYANTGETIWLDGNWCPAICAQTVERAGGTVHDEPDPVLRAKAHKNEAEMAAMRTANARDSVAWVKFLHWLDANAASRAAAGQPITELEAADAILGYRKEANQFMEPSFESISATDGNAALCHYAPTLKAQASVGADSTYLLDSGGQYLDGTTDTTRSVPIGKISDEYRDRYTRVLKGHIALAQLRFPKGTKGHHIDAVARIPLWQVGLDYDHGTGHGVGVCLSVHEGPQRIGKAVNDVELAAGMTITNEPGYYEADKFGIRIENLCEIVEGEDGFLELNDLTLVPIDTRPIDFSLLTKSEVDWLNAYHARVRAELMSQVSGADADWLMRATEAV
ncbi:aminopeptidase P family protein [Kordiimonas sp.]|uniref:aminopeptidase P family protein n=1 Tax=Kordiimonas sp. TaxID=1970157 RepID=UPI003A8F3C3A